MSAILNGTVQCLQFYMEQYNVCYFKWNSTMSSIQNRIMLTFYMEQFTVNYFIWSSSMYTILHGTVQCLLLYMEQYNIYYFIWHSSM